MTHPLVYRIPVKNKNSKNMRQVNNQNDNDKKKPVLLMIANI